MMKLPKPVNLRATTVLLALCAVVLSPTAFATTKGLSQIVTPDLQNEGELSLSFQWQDKRIANPFEFQAELGVTKWLELAVFQGLKPSEQIFGGEIALIQREPWLLSAGFVNWSTRGSRPQPFLEGGTIWNITNSSLVPFTPTRALKRFLATPTISTKRGVRRSIFRVVRQILSPLASLGTSRRTFRSIRPSTSPTIKPMM